MTITIFGGDLTNISVKTEALVIRYLIHFLWMNTMPIHTLADTMCGKLEDHLSSCHTEQSMGIQAMDGVCSNEALDVQIRLDNLDKLDAWNVSDL